ncbi:GNAT family acetyltransferase [Altericroceibacterium xinjiangense]|uniref:GNAT family acetyltransferase n=1 Tax=Altericroceibacterium xinjiangense TaxID=762261 RepID=UPI000F7DD06B|nr:GNAT family acetyltransferase [Altericroceibacterium xinjiangense]
MSLAIRPAMNADGASVLDIWRKCDLTRPWNDPHKDFDRALDCESAVVLLGERGPLPVSTAMTGSDGHRGWIYYLGVLPEFRGHGFGRETLDACCDWLRQRGCPKVELMVRDGNPAAGLYERLGWDLQPVRTYARRLDEKEL